MRTRWAARALNQLIGAFSQDPQMMDQELFRTAVRLKLCTFEQMLDYWGAHNFYVLADSERLLAIAQAKGLLK